MKFSWGKWLFLLGIAASIIVLVSLLSSQPVMFSETDGTQAEYQVRILRDTWGVPHIFGKTDADVAYGLAYAHADDDFETIQKNLLASRGKLAAVFDKDLAPNDYMVQLFKIWDVVNSSYKSDLSKETRAICEAYAAGLNQYAREHPDDILAVVYPVTGKDVVAGFVHKIPLFFGTHLVLQELYEEERKQEISEKTSQPTSFIPKFQFGNENDNAINAYNNTIGSNAFAVSPNRSANGETFLAINSHQPWEGPVAWYEVHLHSEEGWDMVGGVFPGAPVILHGHNRNLGWAHTVNWPDLVDVYVLEINPDNPNQYRFGGEWRELEIRSVPIKVKLLGPFYWTFEREALWSVHGPVVRQPHGTYAIRFSGFGEIRQVEQWFRMNKANNFAEWQQAVQINALPMFNTVYADREGNIYYLYNGQLPVRAEGYDWSKYLPGNTSETLWGNYLAFEKLPQVFNPESGFVQNCNSSPFQTTTGEENPSADEYSTTFRIEKSMSNRALRALELFGTDDSISEAEFYQYKFDMAYSEKSTVAEYIETILQTALPDTPSVREILAHLKSWDLRTNPDNPGAALPILAFQPFLKFGQYQKGIADSLLVESLLLSAKELKAAYGRLDVPWKEVNRLIRGDVNLGLGGGPDVLHAVQGDKAARGRLRGKTGDSYILMVTWDKNGDVHSQSIHQFGSATLDTASPHYADQAPLFVERKLKPVWMDEADIRANLEREYFPGKEMLP